MKNSIFVLILFSALTACSTVSESRLNPFNWFDGASAEPGQPVEIAPLVPTTRTNQVVDQRGLVSKVLSVEVAPISGGILVTASGRTEIPGIYNVDLVPTKVENGTMTLAFRGQFASGGTGNTTVTSARSFSFSEIAGVSRIVVQGQENSLSRRR